MSDNLNTAITAAEEKLEKPAETTKEVKPVESAVVVEETKEEEKKETPSSDSETEMALALFRTLKDPAKSADVIRLMAREAGIIESPKQAEVVAKTIEEVVKEGLGEEYEFLAEKLGPAIKSAVELATKDIREQTERAAQEQEAIKIRTAIDNVMGKYAEAEKLEADVLKLMDEILPSPDQAPGVYFERLLKIAAAEKGVTLKLKTASERISSNRDNAAVRLAAEGGKSDTAVTKTATTMDLNQAIKTAMEQLSKG